MSIKGFPIFKKIALRPAIIIDAGRYRVSFAAFGKNISYHTFIEPSNGKIHGPAIIRRPVPVQVITPFAGIPVPFHIIPQAIDAAPYFSLLWVDAGKVLPGT